MAEENNIAPDPRQKPGSASGSELGDEQDSAAPQGGLAPAGAPAQDPRKPLTPGQRLAQKRDKKALAKKEFKAELRREEEAKAEEEQEEAERLMGVRREPAAPDAVQEAASEFTGYVQDHRSRIVGIVLGVVALGFAVVLGRNFLMAGSAEQAERLASAMELAEAPIDAANTEGKDADGKPVFKSASDRASKAIEAYAFAVKESPDSPAAGWARLGQASLLVSTGKPDQALPLFQASYAARKDDATLGARALEGLGIALEAAGKADDAQKRFQELKGFDDGSHKDLAEYHLARLKLAKGDRDGAKTILKEVYDRLNAPAEGAPRSRFLKGEVEARLAELDSSLVPAGGSEAQQFSQEEIQRLIQQLQQQKGGALPTGE